MRPHIIAGVAPALSNSSAGKMPASSNRRFSVTHSAGHVEPPAAALVRFDFTEIVSRPAKWNAFHLQVLLTHRMTSFALLKK
jgi:hypothetical protein